MKRFFVLPLLILLVSCTAKKGALSTGEGVQTWHFTRGEIAVIFAHGYNDKEWTDSVKAKLEKKYGAADRGGLILPLVYPDDFMHGSNAYISRLSKLLDGRDIEGIVILGAPEGTQKAFTRLSASYGGRFPFGIISLFSQDEVLGMEHFSTIMVDKFTRATLDDINAEAESEKISGAQEMIFRSISVLTSYSEFTDDSSLINAAKYITGNKEIKRYEDPVTSLVCVNHFVME